LVSWSICPLVNWGEENSWQRAVRKGQGAECGALRAKSKALSVEYQESEGYALCAMRYAISAMRLGPSELVWREWPRHQRRDTLSGHVPCTKGDIPADRSGWGGAKS